MKKLDTSRKYPWGWNESMAPWLVMACVPPKTVQKVLRRRAEAWLMSGEPVTGVLAWDRDR